MMIAERLRSLRHENGLSKRELVRLLPLNYSTYANYESGFREPGLEVLHILANHYNVSFDYLLCATEHRKRIEDITPLSDALLDHVAKFESLDAHGKELVSIIMEKELERLSFFNQTPGTGPKRQVDQNQILLPVYDQYTCIGLISYNHPPPNPIETMSFAPTQESKNSDFCVRISGDGMEPKINDGDIVFVKQSSKTEPGSIGLFVYEERVLCKKIRIDSTKDELILESINTSFAPKKINRPEAMGTIGQVLGIAHGGIIV